jgi:hypothetical protein
MEEWWAVGYITNREPVPVPLARGIPCPAGTEKVTISGPGFSHPLSGIPESPIILAEKRSLIDIFRD